MEKIKAFVEVEMTPEEITYLNKLIERDTVADGIPHEGYKTLNYCPICNGIVSNTDSFCGRCGRRVNFVESDVVPL